MRFRWKLLMGFWCLLNLQWAQAATPNTLCVFDVAGSVGEVFNLMKTYQLELMKAGTLLQMRAFPDEAEAVREFKNGQCKIAAIADISAREFNRFTGSISAIGAVPHYSDLKILMYSLADRRMSRHLKNDQYQILGVLPLGAVYLFVNDRAIDRVEDLAGKRISVLNGHYDAAYMVEYVNAVPVPATIATFANMFNKGQVDISYAPAAAYQYLEMDRGMGDKGGIVRYPLGQFTLQLVARADEFDEDFARLSRRIIANLYDTAMTLTARHEQAIPANRWVDIPPDSIAEYQEMLRSVRVQIINGELESQKLANVYHPDMLRLLRKIRCHTAIGSVECTSSDRE